MLSSNRRSLLLLVFLVAALAAVPAFAGPNGNKKAPTLSCTQAGVDVDEVDAGSQFAVSGTGYRAGLTVMVCFSDEYCRFSDVKSDGSFYQGRTLFDPGDYTITVKQSRNRQLGRWDQKASAPFTVNAAY